MELREREERFARSFGSPGILLEKSVDVSLVQSVQCYLRACRRFGGDVFSLPNYTANGDVRPRVEVLDEFRQIQLEVDKAFAFAQGIDLVQRVESVRVKGVKELGRYSSAHLHTDTWAGEPSGGVVMIPIEGDFEKGGVEFFRPTLGTPKEFCRPLEGYELAKDFGPELIGKMREGHLYVLDAFCLHRTMRGGYRCSLDFRFTYKEKLPHDFRGIGKRLANYVPYPRPLFETDKRM